MSATFTEQGRQAIGGMTFHKVKAVTDGATFAYTMPFTAGSMPAPRLLLASFPIITTGGAVTSTCPTYNETTGVLTYGGFDAGGGDTFYFSAAF